MIEHTTNGIRVYAVKYDLSTGVRIECPEDATTEDVMRAYGAFTGWHAGRLNEWIEQGLVNGFRGYDTVQFWTVKPSDGGEE